MKVVIYIYGAGDYERDTLESRMVDTFLLKLKKDFEKNNVPTNIFKTDTNVSNLKELTKY